MKSCHETGCIIVKGGRVGSGGIDYMDVRARE